ncbi:tautomerase family protein [Pseudomonas alliivorans]|uniref:2-hydroxymuconate tautomerase n=1 Tax=Pseudomonas koreensis TaxID=198620 RepID=A0A9X2XES8_9PSED|nr:tautomerase family protein [Pseudomonas koreensis]MCU7247229.1 tautomerase family protein [Pseudomonas koreensis]MEE4914971.1 tautomerase family protein [Pseudomonas alliivorans]
MPLSCFWDCRVPEDEKKHDLLMCVSQAIATSLEVSIDSVRVIIQEIPESQWAAGGQTLAERRASEKSLI